MSLDKAIASGREHRQPYRMRAQRVDPACRCHGSCPWCRGNRLYASKKRIRSWLDNLADWNNSPAGIFFIQMCLEYRFSSRMTVNRKEMPYARRNDHNL